MRNQNEIQRAHDILTSVILGEVEIGACENLIKGVTIACDVLCWTLEHDHNQTFAENLAALEKEISNRGYGEIALEKPVIPNSPEFHELMQKELRKRGL